MLLSTIKKILLLILVTGAQAKAAEFYEPIQTIRQLGMGGVYVFYKSDGASFTQNPAYACMTSGLNWSVANLQLGVGDIADAEDLLELAEEGETPTVSNISEFMGKDVYFKTSGYTSMTLPCFGAFISHNIIAAFSVENPVFPRIETFYLTETTIGIGGGFSFGDNLAFGMDVKRIQRKGGPYTFGPESISLLTEDGAFQEMIQSVENGGMAYGLDVGVVARMSEIPLNPTASLSWKDVGSTAFVKTSGSDAPVRQKDNLVLGMTFATDLPLIGVAGGVEYRHITDNNEQIGKKLHLGAEVSIAMIDVRAGLHQGYPTYGLGMDFWFFELEAALYSVEKGVYPGQTPEQRAQVGLSFSLEFDPNFKLMDFGGKKRRLKQRR